MTSMQDRKPYFTSWCHFIHLIPVNTNCLKPNTIYCNAIYVFAALIYHKKERWQYTFDSQTRHHIICSGYYNHATGLIYSLDSSLVKLTSSRLILIKGSFYYFLDMFLPGNIPAFKAAEIKREQTERRRTRRKQLGRYHFGITRRQNNMRLS